MPKMVIMRGVPGSGKSTLAKQIAKQIRGTICSADDYMWEGGKYVFDVKRLGQAHLRCQRKAEKLCSLGINVIIDNTNSIQREVNDYLEIAKKYNYQIDEAIPNWTPELRTADGKWNFDFLFGRSEHGVDEEKLKLLINRFQWNVTL